MKKERTLSITLNRDQELFLEAYAKIFGSNIHYVAYSLILDGIKNCIEHETLRKAKETFALAKKINRSNDEVTK